MNKSAAKQGAADTRRMTKAQLLASRQWTTRQRDALQALLQDDKTHTVREARQLWMTFIAQEAK